MTPIARRTAALAATLLVAASLVAVTPRAAYASHFTDIGDSPFQTEIEFLVDAGITLGCNAEHTLFCPTDPVRRDQMASFLARGLYLAPASENYFTDDEGSVHEDDINEIKQAGITQGCNPPTNSLYCPALNVRRDQMASFIARALALPAPSDDYFTDDEDITAHENDINRLFEAGITRGCNPPDNDLYCPDQPVTREQMAAFLYRALTVDLEPLPETFGTVADAVDYLLWDVDLELPASCGGSIIVNCPNGNPSSPGPQLSLDGMEKSVASSGGAYTFTVTVSAVSIQDIPVSLFGVDCNLEVDTAPGASPTIDVSGAIDFGPYDPDGPVNLWLPSTELNRLVVESVAVTGVEDDDLSLTGGFQCQQASFTVAAFVDSLTSALEDYVADAAPCGPVGPELFITCPFVPYVGV